jgi:hypothetical protein
VRESGTTLVLVWHLGKWSGGLAFDDLPHGGDGEEWRDEKSEEFDTENGAGSSRNCLQTGSLAMYIAGKSHTFLNEAIVKG